MSNLQDDEYSRHCARQEQLAKEIAYYTSPEGREGWHRNIHTMQQGLMERVASRAADRFVQGMRTEREGRTPAPVSAEQLEKRAKKKAKKKKKRAKQAARAEKLRNRR